LLSSLLCFSLFLGCFRTCTCTCYSKIIFLSLILSLQAGNTKSLVDDKLEIDDDDLDEKPLVSTPSNAGAVDSRTGNSFTPLYWMHEFLDESHRQFILIVLSLPSGLIEEPGLLNRFDVNIAEDGNSIFVKCNFPDVLGDINQMVKALHTRLQLSSSTLVMLKTTGELQLKTLRKQMGVTPKQGMYSTCRIDLQKEVNKDYLEMVPVRDHIKGSCVYIILKVRALEVEENSHAFEVLEFNAPKRGRNKY